MSALFLIFNCFGTAGMCLYLHILYTYIYIYGVVTGLEKQRETVWLCATVVHHLLLGLSRSPRIWTGGSPIPSDAGGPGEHKQK